MIMSKNKSGIKKIDNGRSLPVTTTSTPKPPTKPPAAPKPSTGKKK